MLHNIHMSIVKGRGKVHSGILYRKLPAPSSSSAAFLVASSDCPPPPEPIMREGIDGFTIGVFMLGKKGTVA